MSPPSSGGICMAQIFKSIEPYDIASFEHNSLKTIQLITEAERRAYADRSYYLGDPDFVKIPIDTLISSNYNLKRMNKNISIINFTFHCPSQSNFLRLNVRKAYKIHTPPIGVG